MPRATCSPWDTRAADVALLPLRAFLGVTFVFAGLQKLSDPNFFDAGAASSIQSQLRASERTSPIGGVLHGASHVAVVMGVVIAIAEIVVGLGALLGLWTRWAAAGGLLLSAGFLLAVSWHAHPYYYGADVVFLFAWTPLLLAGAGRFALRRAPPGPGTSGASRSAVRSRRGRLRDHPAALRCLRRGCVQAAWKGALRDRAVPSPREADHAQAGAPGGPRPPDVPAAVSNRRCGGGGRAGHERSNCGTRAALRAGPSAEGHTEPRCPKAADDHLHHAGPVRSGVAVEQHRPDHGCAARGRGDRFGQRGAGHRRGFVLRARQRRSGVRPATPAGPFRRRERRVHPRGLHCPVPITEPPRLPVSRSRVRCVDWRGDARPRADTAANDPDRPGR